MTDVRDEHVAAGSETDVRRTDGKGASMVQMLKIGESYSAVERMEMLTRHTDINALLFGLLPVAVKKVRGRAGVKGKLEIGWRWR